MEQLPIVLNFTPRLLVLVEVELRTAEIETIFVVYQTGNITNGRISKPTLNACYL